MPSIYVFQAEYIMTLLLSRVRDFTEGGVCEGWGRGGGGGGGGVVKKTVFFFPFLVLHHDGG